MKLNLKNWSDIFTVNYIKHLVTHVSFLYSLAFTGLMDLINVRVQVFVFAFIVFTTVSCI